MTTGTGYNPYRDENGKFASPEDVGTKVEGDLADARESGDTAKVEAIEAYAMEKMPESKLGQELLERNYGSVPQSSAAAGSPLAPEYEAYEDEINEEAYGRIRDLQGQERLEAIANSEKMLAHAYREGRIEEAYDQFGEEEDDFTEEQLDSSNYPALNQVYRNSLAAIHGVSKDAVVDNGSSYTLHADDQTHVYSKDFRKLGSFDENAHPDYRQALLDGAAREVPAGKIQVFYSSDAAIESNEWPIDMDDVGESGPYGVSREDFQRLGGIMDTPDEGFDAGYNHGFRESISVKAPGEVAQTDFQRLKGLGAAFEMDAAPGTIVVNTNRLSGGRGDSAEDNFVLLSPDGEARNLNDIAVESLED